MNTDYQDINRSKKPISVKICENQCPNLMLPSNRIKVPYRPAAVLTISG